MKNIEIINLLEAYTPNDRLEMNFKEQIIDFIRRNEFVFGKKNPDGHLTGSAWIVNSNNEKALLTHHSKLDMWLQLGGHSEEDESIKETAIREAGEESGLASIMLISKDIFDIDVQLIPAYHGQKEHFHFDIRFIFEADEFEEIEISSESKDIKWVSLEDINNYNESESILRMVRKTGKLIA